MSKNHSETRLKPDSPQVGQKCPVTYKIFQVGDEVVICQVSGEAFSATVWKEYSVEWHDGCPYCTSNSKPGLLNFGSKPLEPHRRHISIPAWAFAVGGFSVLAVGFIMGILLFRAFSSTGPEDQLAGKSSLISLPTSIQTPTITPKFTSTSILPTPAPTPTFTATPTPILSPVTQAPGVKLHGPDKGNFLHVVPGIPVAVADKVDQRDFIAEVRFYNPHNLPSDGWIYRLGFRSTGSGTYYLSLYFMDNGESSWILFLDTPQKRDAILARRILPNLNILPDGANQLRLEAEGESGRLWVNDEYVATLDISKWSAAGDIWVDATNRASSSDENWSARFDDFTVWSLP
jgi:hypothetical protein